MKNNNYLKNYKHFHLKDGYIYAFEDSLNSDQFSSHILNVFKNLLNKLSILIF